MPFNTKKITGSVREYYTQKVLSHGAIPLGVDWNSRQSQELRFEQLLKIVPFTEKFSLMDWGCGYGALYGYLKRKKIAFSYQGYDLSGEMIRRARIAYGKAPSTSFKVGSPGGARADYALASGIFNVRLGTSNADWKGYLLAILQGMDRASRKGFSFNCLTKYSDKKRMRVDLYYADPLFVFDYCKRRFSRNVALLHDYGLYEFTILVRK